MKHTFAKNKKFRSRIGNSIHKNIAPSATNNDRGSCKLIFQEYPYMFNLPRISEGTASLFTMMLIVFARKYGIEM